MQPSPLQIYALPFHAQRSYELPELEEVTAQTDGVNDAILPVTELGENVLNSNTPAGSERLVTLHDISQARERA